MFKNGMSGQASHAHQDNKNQIQWIGHKQRKNILILCLQLHEGAIQVVHFELGSGS